MIGKMRMGPRWAGLGLALSLGWSGPGQGAIALGAFSEPAGISGYASDQAVTFAFSEWPEENYQKIAPYNRSAAPAFGLDGRRTYVGIDSVVWYEDKDKPCDIAYRIDALNPEVRGDAKLPYIVDQKYADGTGDGNNLCKGSPGNDKSVALPEGQVLQGVAVCTNDKKNSADNRLKGLRLYGASIDAEGKVTAAGGSPPETRHTNCERWHKPVKCPAGQIAAGLRIYHADGAYTGLGLKCRAVETARTPYITGR